MLPFALILSVIHFSGVLAETLCTEANIQLVGRVVFGEARGEPLEGQLAIAWTVVNRVNNHDFPYPNTVYDVVHQKYGVHYEYNTMDHPEHDSAWESAKASDSSTYQNAINAATGALCDTDPDPTGCALAFCATNPCPSTSDTRFATVYNKMQIGKHWFVCQRPK